MGRDHDWTETDTGGSHVIPHRCQNKDAEREGWGEVANGVGAPPVDEWMSRSYHWSSDNYRRNRDELLFGNGDTGTGIFGYSPE